MEKYIEIDVEKLYFWGENPRYGLKASHNTPSLAIEALFELNKDKMVNLAKDLSFFGIVKNDLPLVMKIDDENYKVYEGNRRVANLYCLNDPTLITFSENTQKLYEELDKSKIPSKLMCCVTDDLKYALGVVERLHTGERDGSGRSSWGNSEINSFKDLYQNLFPDNSETSKATQKLDPSYLLIRDYPTTFTNLISKMLKPSNADRILSKEVFMKALGIKEYTDLKPIHIKTIEYILNHAYQEGRKFPGGVSRKYNEPEIITELVPLVTLKIQELSKISTPLPEINLVKDYIYISEGESDNLSKYVSNLSSFEKIEYIPHEAFSLISNSVIPSDLSANEYSISIKGYIDKEEVSSKILMVKVVKTSKTPAKVKTIKAILKHDFASHYTIDISNPINTLINQINKLNYEKHSYIINVCLRILLEEALAIFISNKGLSASGLEKRIEAFVNYFDDAEKTALDTKSKLGYEKLKSIITKTKPKELADDLNPLAHKVTTISKSTIENLAIRVATLLVIISESIK